MGKVKQDSIDRPLPDFGSMYPDLPPEIRVYVANDIKVTREIFIMQIALALYDHTPAADIRKVITILINDVDAKEMITIDGMNFFSYMEFESKQPMTDAESAVFLAEQFPLKTYTVSYDVNIIPLIVAAKRDQKWKRISTFVEATSFRQAKDIFKEQFLKDNPDRKIKMIKVELSKRVNDEK